VSPTYDHVLYIPEICSHEETINYGLKLVRGGASVWVHTHSHSVHCTPNGATPGCGQLTLTENGAILVPDSNTESHTDSQVDN
jgi:hypothetical protein